MEPLRLINTNETAHREEPQCSRKTLAFVAKRVLAPALIIFGALLFLFANAQREASILTGDGAATVFSAEETDRDDDDDKNKHKTKRLITDAFVPTGRSGEATSFDQPVAWFEVNDTATPNKMLNQTIPRDMRFFDKSRSILYCPAAKAGTSTIAALFNISRCPRGTCEDAANALFNNSQKERDLILNSKPLSFTHVRNPWDRIWSTYKGKIATCKIDQLPGCPGKPLSFNDFLDFIVANKRPNAHWLPFSKRCLVTPDENGNVFRYDHVIRLEDDLMLGLNQVAQEAGLEWRAPQERRFHNTEHSVAARHAFYRAEAEAAGLTLQQLVDKVYEIYKADIDGLGYSFDRYG